ncbi:ZIP family metal transporter [Nocardioides insulae]|uniref:ZIP family metal transporter n=1 Tax=Nocardioides insulae TaxID=394734 RepID=UPI0003FE3872|nr:ZIP family zinc transporter [Nocardioides insulae]
MAALALIWGIVASSSLILGGLLTFVTRLSPRTVGVVMAFGGGVLISAVAYELVEEAYDGGSTGLPVAAGLFAGSVVFFAGDALIDRMGGDRRKSSSGAQAGGVGLAIVLGIVLDGIPESMTLGLTVLTDGTVSIALLAAVFVSNLPEAVAATVGLTQAGWSRARILGLWALVCVVSGLASLVGATAFASASAGVTAFVLAFAGGAILTMLADTMMPEAYEQGGRVVGLVTTLGFAVAFAISVLE